MLVGLEYWHIQKYKSSYLEEKDQSFDTLLHKYRRSIFGAFVEEFQLIQMNKGEGEARIENRRRRRRRRFVPDIYHCFLLLFLILFSIILDYDERLKRLQEVHLCNWKVLHLNQTHFG